MGRTRRSTAPRRRTAPERSVPRRGAVPVWWRTPGWLMRAVAVVLVVIGAVVWLVGRSSESGPVELTHVHGLGVNPATGTVYVATHDGLYLLGPHGQASLVGQGRQDTMGFTVAGPDRFLASGHPAPGQGGPRHLGLIESTDAGLTWVTRSLAGKADFHALRFRHATAYGYNSASGQLMASTDLAQWRTLAAMELFDFDVHPADAKQLLAITATGLARSRDGGVTWTTVDGAPPLELLAWQASDQLWALSRSGEVLRSADAGATWLPTGRLAGPATAFAAHDGVLYAAVHERGIFRSGDAGATWTALYQ